MSGLTLFVGGSVGSNPRSPHTWSGICTHLIAALERKAMLDSAIGVTLPRLKEAALQVANFHPNRNVWRSQFYFDPSYRKALTRAAATVPANGAILLQIGHMFSLPDAFPAKHCISYHDGNLAQKLKSGHGIEKISRRRIDQALHFEQGVARRLTGIFTFSEYLRQSFINDYGVDAERVFNVGAGINLTHIPEDNPEKDYSAPDILFIGIEFERKGGPQLLEAFRRVREKVPSAKLHIVGPEALDTEAPGVIFHGRLLKSDPVQKCQLEALFRRSSLFVLPSLYEPFGIAPLEAMLYQVPCVVTDAWALREIVRPGINGDLVGKGSIDELAEKLLILLSMPDALAQMGRRGRDLVLQNYTWDAVADRIETALVALGLPAPAHRMITPNLESSF